MHIIAALLHRVQQHQHIGDISVILVVIVVALAELAGAALFSLHPLHPIISFTCWLSNASWWHHCCHCLSNHCTLRSHPPLHSIKASIPCWLCPRIPSRRSGLPPSSSEHYPRCFSRVVAVVGEYGPLPPGHFPPKNGALLLKWGQQWCRGGRQPWKPSLNHTTTRVPSAIIVPRKFPFPTTHCRPSPSQWLIVIWAIVAHRCPLPPQLSLLLLSLCPPSPSLFTTAASAAIVVWTLLSLSCQGCCCCEGARSDPTGQFVTPSFLDCQCCGCWGCPQCNSGHGRLSQGERCRQAAQEFCRSTHIICCGCLLRHHCCRHCWCCDLCLCSCHLLCPCCHLCHCLHCRCQRPCVQLLLVLSSL